MKRWVGFCSLGVWLACVSACDGQADVTFDAAGTGGSSGSGTGGSSGSTTTGGTGGSTGGSGGSFGSSGTSSTAGLGGSHATGGSAGSTAGLGGSHATGGSAGSTAGLGGAPIAGQAGDEATGGTPAEGGSDPGAGAGGAANDACPSTAPEAMSECNVMGRCLYVGLNCNCMGRGEDKHWQCRGSGATCPSTIPVNESLCVNPEDGPGLECPYPDGTECRCMGEGWRCDAPPDGPGM